MTSESRIKENKTERDKKSERKGKTEGWKRMATKSSTIRALRSTHTVTLDEIKNHQVVVSDEGERGKRRTGFSGARTLEHEGLDYAASVKRAKRRENRRHR